MMPFTEYLIKVSLGFAVVSLFYVLVLKRLTFYNWNRAYLLLASALCFVAPVSDVNAVLDKVKSPPGRELLHQIPSVSQVISQPIPDPLIFVDKSVSVPEMPVPQSLNWIFIIWITGVAIMLVRLAMHIVSLARIMHNARLAYNDGVRIYHFNEDINPFSFGKAIFYNPALHTNTDLPDIMLHEFVHVRQHHTLDVIWGEIICIINWFNPLVWLLTKAMRQNLEYIADREVLENHPDMKAYQYLLLKTTMRTDLNLANQFGYHSLKQRIVMMNRKRSPRLALMYFLLLLPLTALLFAAFRPEPVHYPEQVKGLMNSKEKRPSPVVYMSGLILDNITGKPIANMPLNVERFRITPLTGRTDTFTTSTEPLGLIYTDEDGFFFKPVLRDTTNEDFYSYSIGYNGKKYGGFSFSVSNSMPGQVNESFAVVFTTQIHNPGSRKNFYWINSDDFYLRYNGGSMPKELKKYLYAQLPPFLAEHKLCTEFRLRYKYVKNIITKFKNGYFDRKGELMGYVGELQFYLDGKKATYQEVNDAFFNYPYDLGTGHEYR